MKTVLASVTLLALAGCQTTTSPARVLYPVKECADVQVPIYGLLDRPASDMEVIGGAVAGGVVGNQLGNGNGKTAMTVLGAIIGGNVASGRKQEEVITGYKTEHQCRTVYK